MGPPSGQRAKAGALMTTVEALAIVKERRWVVRAIRSRWVVKGRAFPIDGDIDLLPTRILAVAEDFVVAVEIAVTQHGSEW